MAHGAEGAGEKVSGTTRHDFESFDGTRLAYHRTGAGRPVLMLHGLFSSSDMNWIKWGQDQRLADAGFEAIMLDFRVHGESEAPRDPNAYLPAALVRDAAALADHLGLEEGRFDLVGFSLGARTALHAAAHDVLRPRRLVACGMGVEGLAEWERRAAHFKRVIDEFDTIRSGSPLYTARTFLKSQGVDRVAARLLLDAMEPFDLAGLANITMPAASICGADDHDNGSAEELARLLPNAVYREVPGTHLNSVTKPELGEAIAAFLSAEDPGAATE
jgi:pimeloyl-ACP methyl ester carboxylesterase